MLTSLELTTRRQSRTTYANNIIQKQKVAQGCTTRITIGGDEGTLASDITLLREGAVFTTVEEQAAILAANNCTPYVKQLVYAIPDFRYTVNSILGSPSEPGTWQAIASGLPNPLMNGTYTTTGSHFFVGDMGDNLSVSNNASGTIKSFMRIQPSDSLLGGWLSRTGSNNYSGSYNGNTGTIVDGINISGEYMTITAPYYFILNSYSLVSGHRAQTNNYITSWVIVGSKDGGSTYHTIDVQTNVTMIDNIDALPNHGGHITIELPSNTRAYNNYRIIVTANKLTSTDGANIDAFNLFTYM